MNNLCWKHWYQHRTFDGFTESQLLTQLKGLGQTEGWDEQTLRSMAAVILTGHQAPMHPYGMPVVVTVAVLPVHSQKGCKGDT